MARKRKGRVVNGVLLVSKRSGASSNQILQKVRWLYQAQKAGHGGTLDPFAEGLLPILFGEATKFGQYILGANKRYIVEICFGCETDTADREGKRLYDANIPALQSQNWEKVLTHFRGHYLQTPPIYSALKVHGKRAYELARQGKIPELVPRPVYFYEINLLEVSDDSIRLDVLCSKGTYIRALARDIGRYLNSRAYAHSLIRTGVGEFSLAQAQSIPMLENLSYEELDENLLPIETCVKDLTKLIVPTEKIRFIRHGNDIAISAQTGQYALFEAEEFFGVGTVKNSRLYPNRLCALTAHRN